MDEALLHEVMIIVEEMPSHVREYFANMHEEVFDHCQENQIPPRTVAAILGLMMGTCALAEFGPYDHDEIDRFVAFALMATQAGVVAARIEAGWIPPEGSGLSNHHS